VAYVLAPANPELSDEASWWLSHLRDTGVTHYGSRACVLRDGHAAIFGGLTTTACEALALDGEDK